MCIASLISLLLAASPTILSDVEACEHHRAAIQTEYGSTESRTSDSLPCSLTADLDGDGKPDQLRFVHADGRTGLAVRWGRGGDTVLSSVAVEVEGQVQGEVEDFSWLLAWHVLPRTGEIFEVSVLGRPVPVPRGAALGDALWCTSSDVASLLVFTAEGWRLRDLGY